MKAIRAPRADRLKAAGPRERRGVAIVGDTQVGLWVVRSLGRGGLVVLAVCQSERGLVVRSRYAAGVWQIEHGPTEPEFVDEIEALVREYDAGSVLTIAESYHAALIRERGRFEPHVHVFSPPAEAFARATDKGEMHRLAERLDIPVARGTTLDRLAAKKDEKTLRFPLVLRTRQQNDPRGAGHAPWKAAYAADEKELDALAAQVRGMADNVLVQECHPGAEDHVQVLMHEGRAVMTGEYLGEHHMPLAGGVTVQRVTCRHEAVTRDAVRLLEAVGWEGVAGVQFHFDPTTGRYIFLEINPRFIGGLPTVIRAGFDAPFLLWQSRFEPEKMRPGRYRLGRRTRILGGDANWLLAVLRGDPMPPGEPRPGRAAAVAQFLWNSGPWTRDDTFWWRDPRPFWTDLRAMAGRLRQRRVDLIGGPESEDRETR